MRIGISCQPSAGGSGIMATELGIALAERGHHIHFVTTERPFRLGDFHSNILSHLVDVSTYPLFRAPPMSLALASKISEVAEEYDIERKFRETRLYQVAPISTNLILSYIAEHVLGLPRSF